MAINKLLQPEEAIDTLWPDVFVLFIHQLCPHDSDKLVDDEGNKEDSKDVNPSKSVQHGCLRMGGITKTTHDDTDGKKLTMAREGLVVSRKISAHKPWVGIEIRSPGGNLSRWHGMQGRKRTGQEGRKQGDWTAWRGESNWFFQTPVPN